MSISVSLIRWHSNMLLWWTHSFSISFGSLSGGLAVRSSFLSNALYHLSTSPLVCLVLSYLHSKNSRVRFDPERVPFGQTHFWVRPDQKTTSDWPGIRVRKTFFYSDFVSVWPRFRISLTQKWVWPNGTLSGSNLTREFFRVYRHPLHNCSFQSVVPACVSKVSPLPL